MIGSLGGGSGSGGRGDDVGGCGMLTAAGEAQFGGHRAAVPAILVGAGAYEVRIAFMAYPLDSIVCRTGRRLFA